MSRPQRNDVTQSMKRAAQIVAFYDRVHVDLDAGKKWDEIDHGLSGDKWSYDGWNAYMEQRLKNELRSILLEAGLL